MLKLGNLDFAVNFAELRGVFTDAAMSRRMSNEEKPSFSWYLEICTEEGELITEADFDEEDEEIYEVVRLRLYHNNGFSLNVKSWKALEGLSKIWTSSENEAGEEAGTLYVFEHEAVTSGRIEFLKRSGSTFFVRWSGTADVCWNKEYGKDVPFLFEGEVEFSGISAECDKIDSLAELEPVMTEFIDLKEFTCVSEKSHKIQKGTSYSWKFAPKE